MEADIQNNTAKIYILKDELIAFEDNYIKFKNQTINKLNILNLEVESQASKILNLESDYNQFKFNAKLLFGLVLVTLILMIALFSLLKGGASNARNK